MPKLRNVTDAELIEFTDQAVMDTGQIAYDYCQRISQNYCEPITTPLQRATMILSASRSLADLAHAILAKAQLEEQKTEIEKTLRARAS